MVKYNSWHVGLASSEQIKELGGVGEELGDGRAEGWSAIGDRGKAAISLTPDVDGMHVHL